MVPVTRTNRWLGSCAALIGIITSTSCGDTTQSIDSSACSSLSEITNNWTTTVTYATPPTARQRIADELLKCHALQGRSARVVRNSLGSPDNYVVDDPIYRSPPGSSAWSYNLGAQRWGAPIDNEHLLVQLNSQGKVSSVRIVTD